MTGQPPSWATHTGVLLPFKIVRKSHKTSTSLVVTGRSDTSLQNKGETLQTEPQRTDKANCEIKPKTSIYTKMQKAQKRYSDYLNNNTENL